MKVMCGQDADLRSTGGCHVVIRRKGELALALLVPAGMSRKACRLTMLASRRRYAALHEVLTEHARDAQ